MTTKSKLHQICALSLFLCTDLVAHAASPADLFKAADAGNVKAVQASISQGVPVDSADQDGWTPLMVAAASGKLPVVQALIKSGANVNARTAKGDTPLMAAVLSGNVAIVKLLLSEGADKTLQNAQGITAADVAIKAKNEALVKLLASSSRTASLVGSSNKHSFVSPKIIEAKVNEAAEAFKAGAFVQAAQLFKDVVDLDPKHALAWHFLGQSLANIGDVVGARKAYYKVLALQPEGDVANRTKTFLAKLPMPNPAKIALANGMTLYDWIGITLKNIDKDNAWISLQDSSQYINDYGKLPELVSIQNSALNLIVRDVKLDSAEAAMSGEQTIKKLRSLVGDTPALVALSARANHVTGNFHEAIQDYSLWLRLAPTESSRRSKMVDGLLKAQHGDALALSSTAARKRPTLPFQISDHVWSIIEESEAFQNSPEISTIRQKYTNESVFARNYPSTTTKDLMISPLDENSCAFSKRTENTVYHRSDMLQNNIGPQISASFFCAGGLISLGFNTESETGASKPTDLKIEGSIFPLEIGKKMTVFSKVELSGKNREILESKWRTQTSHYEVMGTIPANKLHPNLDGNAWKVKVYSDQRYENSKYNSDDDYFDYFVESLGTMISFFWTSVYDDSTPRAQMLMPGRTKDPTSPVEYIVPTDGAAYSARAICGACGTNGQSDRFHDVVFDVQQ